MVADATTVPHNMYTTPCHQKEMPHVVRQVGSVQSCVGTFDTCALSKTQCGRFEIKRPRVGVAGIPGKFAMVFAKNQVGMSRKKYRKPYVFLFMLAREIFQAHPFFWPDGAHLPQSRILLFRFRALCVRRCFSTVSNRERSAHVLRKNRAIRKKKQTPLFNLVSKIK